MIDRKLDKTKITRILYECYKIKQFSRFFFQSQPEW